MLAAVPLLIAARPQSDLQLFTQLNGQPVRWRLPDGGSSGLYAASGIAYASLDGGLLNGQAFQPNVVLFVPETPTNICIRPSVDSNGRRMAWDGGCNMIAGDENFGVGLQPYVPYYFVPHPNATTIVGVSDAGLVRGALFQMQ
jgi:hypothetical protein